MCVFLLRIRLTQRNMKLSTLLNALPQYYTLTNPIDSTISAIVTDSRQVEQGALFVAYKGVNLDSHHFIPQAIAKGATVIICERNVDVNINVDEASRSVAEQTVTQIVVPNGREALGYLSAAWQGWPSRQLRLVGLTGTDGKTTTINLLYQILRATQTKVSMISTVNAVIGDQILQTGLHTTTPDAPEIQAYLSQMVQANTQTCLLEVTSHGLAHHRVTGCEFDIAVVTNITHEHLDAHGDSLDEYRAAKAKLFESLATSKEKQTLKVSKTFRVLKLAVLNCDDWSFDYLRTKLEAQHTPWIGYSLTNHAQATIIATEISYQVDKTHFTIQHGQRPLANASSLESFIVETKLVGDYNVSNCLAAISTGLIGFDLTPQIVQTGIAQLQGIPGRMERIDEGQPFLALVDFAHTPNSLRRSLQVARSMTSGRVIAVFGCAGLRDVDKRAMMGRIAAELADVTIITAEDPRTETLSDIIATTAKVMLAHGAVEGQTFERVLDRGRAIYRATQLAQPNDIVLALGKGHEQSMCFGQTEYPWDDREALRHALRGQPLLTLPTA